MTEVYRFSAGQSAAEALEIGGGKPVALGSISKRTKASEGELKGLNARINVLKVRKKKEIKPWLRDDQLNGFFLIVGRRMESRKSCPSCAGSHRSVAIIGPVDTEGIATCWCTLCRIFHKQNRVARCARTQQLPEARRGRLCTPSFLFSVA